MLSWAYFSASIRSEVRPKEMQEAAKSQGEIGEERRLHVVSKHSSKDRDNRQERGSSRLFFRGLKLFSFAHFCPRALFFGKSSLLRISVFSSTVILGHKESREKPYTILKKTVNTPQGSHSWHIMHSSAWIFTRSNDWIFRG